MIRKTFRFLVGGQGDLRIETLKNPKSPNIIIIKRTQQTLRESNKLTIKLNEVNKINSICVCFVYIYGRKDPIAYITLIDSFSFFFFFFCFKICFFFSFPFFFFPFFPFCLFPLGKEKTKKNK